jgi:hypothetical protein
LPPTPRRSMASMASRVVAMRPVASGAGGRQRVDQPVDRLGAGDRRLEVGDQHLVVDQLVDVRLRLLEGDLGISARRRPARPVARPRRRAPAWRRGSRWRRRRPGGSCGCARRRCRCAPRRSAARSPTRYRLELGRKVSRGRNPGIARQPLGERADVVHVEAGVALVGGAPLDGEPVAGRRPSDGAAGEQAERRGAAGHAHEVAHEGPLDLLAALARGLLQPRAHALVERR